jgi:ketosteroid isomerase-like protein
MSSLSPTALVQQMYQAFGQGDVPAMLEALTDDFAWDSRYPTSVPLSGIWRGRDGLLGLLQAITSSVDVLAFEVREFIAEGDRVVALGRDESRAKATGRVYPNEWVHVWTIQGGKLAHVVTYNDTAAAEAAFS